jgi:hypothetical protein
LSTYLSAEAGNGLPFAEAMCVSVILILWVPHDSFAISDQQGVLHLCHFKPAAIHQSDCWSPVLKNDAVLHWSRCRQLGAEVLMYAMMYRGTMVRMVCSRTNAEDLHVTLESWSALRNDSSVMNLHWQVWNSCLPSESGFQTFLVRDTAYSYWNPLCSSSTRSWWLWKTPILPLERISALVIWL